MISQIKQLRVQIDGLAKLTSELKPFQLIVKELTDYDTSLTIDSIVAKVPSDLSEFPRYKTQYLIRTDKDTFRFGTNNRSGDDKWYLRRFQIDQNSKEINDAAHSLLYAKAWLGKVLELLGNESPYKNDGKRTDVASIEPTADTGFYVYPRKASELIRENEDGSKEWSPVRDFNHIEKVDYIRQEIKNIHKELVGIALAEDQGLSGTLFKSMDHLTEARFALGFELQRIKENENEKTTNDSGAVNSNITNESTN